MKYKIGDRVIIKKDDHYSPDAKRALKKINYIGTIKEMLGEKDDIDNEGYYILEKLGWRWREHHIEGISLELEKLFSPIIIRFELMDFE